jgi:hypothetical protein
MSQKITLSTEMSPAQTLAVAALAGGATVTEAAHKAGVARETVSRWLHRDPRFIAELQTTRAELAVQTRCALEALGEQSVDILREAMQLQRGFMAPRRLKAACAVLKMIGADRAEIVPPPTAEEVHVRLCAREAELRKRQSEIEAIEMWNALADYARDKSEASSGPAGTNPSPCPGDPAEPIDSSGSPRPDGLLPEQPPHETAQPEHSAGRQDLGGRHSGPAGPSMPVMRVPGAESLKEDLGTGRLLDNRLPSDVCHTAEAQARPGYPLARHTGPEAGAVREHARDRNPRPLLQRAARPVRPGAEASQGP